MTTEYTLIETTTSAEDFCRLRKIAGLSARPLAAAEIGLPRSCYGVHILWQGTPVGMGRIVGDGALNFEIVDIADVPELYAKFGFESVRPESEGMARVWK
ncbi:TPA: GNAT family N-acetyltransferase [Kluyvera ascorbata]|uniref:GNAT family N-acetyltransferase n=1 Tax=Kluyvera ascorbata TaxID=51288 RepID=UPI0018A43CE4|nr:GNAT family N-acetyltransferase [Kluyvera ascorbata]BBV68474.1 hypothetical protein STW0522KLE44_48620 [Klebsiella sp. STW0522-44]MDU3914085.1 GNAT family N-acetyltransferase [Kluyvera ascorbata]HAT7515500.1 GNAT family N-acetyltransferase [Kluyvera ascorbata]HCL5619095.1 GNAT family N-acetyltransferase [Kluyvera ascorbata]HDG1663810.1 GNAT family N-acetyltransferase [Kluyvera ascorbata]